MEIKIEQPISLHLEVFETDDHVPSMHMNAQIVVSQFQHTCRYDGAFWIECASWDKFTDSLRGSSWQEAVLRDISENFMLALRRTDEAVLLVWEFAKKDIGGKRQINVVFSSEIDDDMLGKIKSEFLEFPVWW
ncbi:MAG: hypothetical protein FWG56_01530 [Desulfovibrionaceae bacterium]|jgi:hypothetical protein|nr:hypothetical protein [Desulfovibrionaceae bacterium]